MNDAAALTFDLLAKARPEAVRYIKLGAGGAWEAASIDGDRIDFGTQIDPHDLAHAGNWDGARQHYLSLGKGAGTATGYVNQLRDFYAAGPDTLWITFARGQLWWAFAEAGVHTADAATGRVFRRTIGRWRNVDTTGQSLAIVDLSTRLTSVASYQQTICKVAAADYLLRRLHDEPEPAVVAAQAARSAYAEALLPLIQHLHQDEFELFTDLLFGRIGWRRISALGGTMKDIDMLLELPATGERAAVQVKSAADQQVFKTCVEAFQHGGVGDRFYFVCHSPKGIQAAPEGALDRVHVLTGLDLAQAAVAHGMADWLFARAA